jgi:hypothetical protein
VTLDVTRNLRLEFVKTGKFHFVTQLVQEADGQVRAVDVGGKIKQVNFENRAYLRHWLSAGNRDWRRRAVACRHGRSSPRRQTRFRAAEAGRVSCGCWPWHSPTDGANLGAMNDATIHHVRPAEQLGGALKIAGPQGIAYRRTRHTNIAGLDGAHRLDAETERLTGLLQQRKVTSPFRTEAEVIANDQVPHAQ